MRGELRLYDVTVGAHKTQMRLDDRDAAAMGDSAVLCSERDDTPSLCPMPTDPIDTTSGLVASNKMRGAASPVRPVPSSREGGK